MSADIHPWGIPPWTVDFRPHSRPLPDEADVVVVGGGFSGLSAAAWLKRLAPKESVLVLEAEKLGNGASGRTGGIALADTAAGSLPGLGDVLRGYRRILRTLRVEAELSTPGVFELGRSGSRKHSPIQWNDSGNLRVLAQVPGGTVNPGRVVAGLARAAQSAGAHIVENAKVIALEPAAQGSEHGERQIQLKVRVCQRQSRALKIICAGRVLLATNALALDLAGLAPITQPKLTLAVATAPLTRVQIHSLGLSSRKPFYTVDLPYLWGRLLKNNAAIFGAGLVPASDGPGLRSVNVRKGEAAERLALLEARVRALHPCLRSVRFTRRWGGPILLTEKAKPVFREHSLLPNVTILAGFHGHGVALSVYLGRWAAQSILGYRKLPAW